MEEIVLKNAEKLQTIRITFDGFSFQQEIIQHSLLMTVKSTMELDVGGADEAVDCIAEYMQNGFNVYVNGKSVHSVRSVVHAVDKLGGDYDE